MPTQHQVKRRWRDYQTSAGRRPVKEYIQELTDDDAEEVIAAMKDVALHGLQVARHLRREIYEVRADGPGGSYRVLFAEEGRRGRILLSLVAFAKKTQKTPPGEIETAERRLRDWRRRRKPAKA